MGICPKQIIELVIYPALVSIGYGDKASVQLVSGTCAQESDMGAYIKQVDGPALGLFQMEPATHTDIWMNYLRYHQELVKKICQIAYIPVPNIGVVPYDETLMYNMKYAAIMCRLKYLMNKESIPSFGSVIDQANYWKKYYNTAAGKGDVQAYLVNFDKYLKPYYASS
jgi:hypothetical protein